MWIKTKRNENAACPRTIKYNCAFKEESVVSALARVLTDICDAIARLPSGTQQQMEITKDYMTLNNELKYENLLNSSPFNMLRNVREAINPVFCVRIRSYFVFSCLRVTRRFFDRPTTTDNTIQFQFAWVPNRLEISTKCAFRVDEVHIRSSNRF